MPIITPRDTLEIRGDIIRRLKRDTPITNYTDSSRTMMFINPIASEISQLWAYLSEAQKQSFLTTATGVDLDYIGDLYGVKRLGAQRATSQGGQNNVKFYVPNGGTLSQDLTIPAGVTVYAGAQTNNLSYTTMQPAIFVASVTREVFVDVEANVSGTSHNIPKRTVNAHNYSPAKNLISVTNIHPIGSGTDLESDMNYRSRIRDAIIGRLGPNNTTLRFEALKVPGVADIVVIPFARGAGTVDVVVIGTEPEIGMSVLRDVKMRIASTAVAFGIDIEVYTPEYVTVGMGIQASISDQALTTTTVTSDISSTIRRFINSTPMGNTLILSQLVQAALNASPHIKDINIKSIRINGENTVIGNVASPTRRSKIVSGEVIVI